MDQVLKPTFPVSAFLPGTCSSLAGVHEVELTINMMPIDAKTARATGFLLIYALFFWRLIKSNRGDKFIQCGSITVMLFLVLMVLSRIPNFPLDDYAPWFAISLFLLCVLTMFYLFQQLYRERKQKMQKHHKASVADHSSRTE